LTWGLAKMSAEAAPSRLRIRLCRSLICRTRRQRACVRGLGLWRIDQVVEREDTPAIRGMIRKVSFMLEVEET